MKRSIKIIALATIILAAPLATSVRAADLTGDPKDKVDVVIEDGEMMVDANRPGILMWSLYDEKGNITGHSEYDANTLSFPTGGADGDFTASIQIKYVFEDGSTVSFDALGVGQEISTDAAVFLGVDLPSGSPEVILNVWEGTITGGTGKYNNVSGDLFYRSRHVKSDQTTFFRCDRCMGTIVYTRH